MKELNTVLNGFDAEYQGMAEQLLSFLPSLALALIVLLLGWLLAILGRLLLQKTMTGVDRFWQYLAVRFDQPHFREYRSPTKFLSELLFWLIILVTVLLVTDILGLKIFRSWLTALIAYLPLVAGAALLVFVGTLTGVLVRDGITKASERGGLPHGQIMGRSAQALILLIAIVLGFDQLGLDIAFLSVIIGIALASVLGSVGLAFGLGARHQVSNMLAAKQATRRLELGDRLRVGDIEGVLTEIGATCVTLEQDKTRVVIPAAMLETQITLIHKQGEGK